MTSSPTALSAAQIESFVADGFVRIDDAFSRETAEAGRAILWRETGCDPEDPASWTEPVIRLGGYSDPPFREAANTPRLTAAYDALAGAGTWVPPQGLGTFPVRFPSATPPGDDGWHIDVSFVLPQDDPSDIFSYRANIASRGRALLMLFLFSDVGADDAPTRIRVGSHTMMARELAPFGDAGRRMSAIGADGFTSTAECPEVSATGPAGTVYLCHPFLVHAARPHRGVAPKFMAQPPLVPRRDFDLDGDREIPMVRAISEALR